MTIWVIAIIILNVIVLLQKTAPPFVKLNAGMVTVIAVVALVRIWQKKRQRLMEKMAEELRILQRENEQLKKMLGELESQESQNK